MRPVPSARKAAVFALFVAAAAAVFFTAGWAQVADRPSTPASPQSGNSALPNSTDEKAHDPGVWHHFGAAQDSSPAVPGQPGTWQPPYSHQFPTWRNLGLSRTRELEQLMHELVNRDRADPANAAETKGRAFPLRWNDTLAVVARAHSVDMLNRHYFSHEDPEGRSVATRVEASGINWQAVGENIAIYNNITSAEAAFMNEPRFSKNHRANILSANYTDIGIGIVQGRDGSLYITQDFFAGPTHTATSSALRGGGQPHQ